MQILLSVNNMLLLPKVLVVFVHLYGTASHFEAAGSHGSIEVFILAGEGRDGSSHQV